MIPQKEPPERDGTTAESLEPRDRTGGTKVLFAHGIKTPTHKQGKALSLL